MRKINVLCIRSNGYFQVFRVAPLINRPQYLNSLNALFANPFRNANLSESVDTWNCNVDESIYNNTSSDFFFISMCRTLVWIISKKHLCTPLTSRMWTTILLSHCQSPQCPHLEITSSLISTYQSRPQSLIYRLALSLILFICASRTAFVDLTFSF